MRPEPNADANNCAESYAYSYCDAGSQPYTNSDAYSDSNAYSDTDTFAHPDAHPDAHSTPGSIATSFSTPVGNEIDGSHSIQLSGSQVRRGDIWIPYLFRSKRVKTTFANGGKRATSL